MTATPAHSRFFALSRSRFGNLFAFLFLLCIGLHAYAGQATVAWDGSPSAGVAGYMLYYGQTSGNYASKIDVGNTTNTTVPSLLDGKTYYFVTTAYDLSRTESGFSNEASTTIASAAPVASFSATSTSGVAPLAVTFTSTSSGAITSYAWNFGDGTASNTQNPTHSYSSPGTYSVSLQVTGPGGSNTQARASYITVSASPPVTSPPVASFTASTTSGTAPLNINFTSTSTGSISSYAWNFGDGATSAAQNPSHSYAASGTYTVSLTVNGAGGSNTQTKAGFISVATGAGSGSTIPVADFTSDKVSGGVPLGVNFKNTSTGNITRYYWNFGDNGSSKAQNPWHSYSRAGVYTVTLKVSGPNGSNTRTKTGYVTVGTPTPAPVPPPPPAPAPGPVPTDRQGLVAAYSFDEGTGSTVNDLSGNGNVGTISGATWVSTGRFRNALSFNGLNNWVTIKDAPSLDLTNGMTLEAWVYPKALYGWTTVMMKEQPGNDIYYLAANSDKDQPATGVFIGSEQKLYAGTKVALFAWTHLAATYDGAIQRLYINGVQVASRTQTGSIRASSDPLRIGGDGIWGEYFTGLIDEIRIYNRALSAGEIQTDMGTAVSP